MTEDPILLWHDDVRPPEQGAGWTWVKTNVEAQELLETGRVVAIDLDHDLGADLPDGHGPLEHLHARGRSPDGTGYDLVRWMIRRGLVPQRVRIHSWYPKGAIRMAAALISAGYGERVEVRRYVPPVEMFVG